ncbi:hypothetical protein F2Q68_00005416 [Brassica cretica]|uniref:Uncharacterized protein n=1 Tax=Brassica cretica TaxID=69181 RepID=A0A8S9JBC9_BRACR|nr:hypothetical protein F2Q68_00005416 [Brassica cretica]
MPKRVRPLIGRIQMVAPLPIDSTCFSYLYAFQNPMLIKKFKSCKLTQMPREQNSQADALANQGSALETNIQMSIPLLVLQWPATLEEPPSEEADIFPEDRNEARKIKKRAASLTDKPSPQTNLWSTCLKSDWKALTGNGRKNYTEFSRHTGPLPKQQQGKLPTRLVYGSEATIPTVIENLPRNALEEDGKMRMMNDRSEHRTLKCALIPNNRKSPKECTRRLVKRISFDPKMD